MSIITSIGAKTFSASILISIVATVYATVLASNGVDPEVFNLPVFMGMKKYYDVVYNIYNALPKDHPVSNDVFYETIKLVLTGSLVEFLTMFLVGFFLLVASISTVMPREIAFLVTGLYPVAAFLQVTAWIYLASIFRDMLGSLISFIKR